MSQREKILVFRSAASWIFDKAIEDLNAAATAPTIDVYSPKTYAEELRQQDRFNEVIDLGWDGFFKNSSITAELLKELRSRGYDRVVVVYSDVHGDNYGPLRSLAFKLKPAQVHSFNCNLVWTRLERQSWLMRYVLPRKWFYNLMLVVFCFEIIMTTLWDRSVFILKRFLRGLAGSKT